MARKKKQDPKKNMVAGRADIRRLWKVIPVPEWLALFQEIAPSNRWEMSGIGSIRACCPYHDDDKPSFHMSFNKRMGKCFGDTCAKVVVDLIALVAKLRNCSYTEALLFLNDRFDLGKKLVSNTDELNKYNNIQELKKQAAIAANNVLHEVVRENPAHLSYCWPAVTYLLEVRKLPLETLSALPVGVFAKPIHMKKYIPETLHTQYDEYFAKYQSIAFWGALLFHYNDSPGSITRFKLRLRNLDIPNCSLPELTKEKVESLHDTDKLLLYKREYAYVEDPYPGSFGLFGLHAYHHMIGQNDTDAYITEGEFDVLSVLAAQVKRQFSDFIVLGTGGKGSTSVGFLREYGIRSCWLVPDHPAKNGDAWALSVLGDRTNFTTGPDYTKPLDFKVFEWPVSITGMDLDEAVRKTGYEHILDMLGQQRMVNFKNAFRWIKARADDEVQSIKRTYESRIEALDPNDTDVTNERESLVDEKRHKLYEVLGKWYRYLHDQTDRLAFTQDYEANEGLDLSQIEEINQQVKGLDTVEGVKNLVRKELEEIFTVSFWEKRSNEPRITAWSIVHRLTFQLYAGEKAFFQMLSVLLGGDCVKWCKDLLGNNKILLENTENLNTLKAETIIAKNAQTIFQMAFADMYNDIPCKDQLIRVGQGIHHATLQTAKNADKVMYFVNGSRVFKGHFDDSDSLDWTLIDSNVHNGFLFSDLAGSEQWSSVSTVSDLPTKQDDAALAETFAALSDILAGWKFEHDDIIRQYFAAYIMSIPVMVATGGVNITYVSGEKESGKTSLVVGLLGGQSGGGIGAAGSILEPARSTFDITRAGMYQNFCDRTLAMIVDEAEVSPQHRTSHDEKFKEILRMAYNLPMGGITIDRGGITQDQKVHYRLFMPLLMAAINIPTDNVFLSRIMWVNTLKDPGRQSPIDRMMERYEPDQLERLRKSLTVSLLPYVPEIMRKREELKTRLPQVASGVCEAANRFMESLLTPLAVYALLGRDAEALYVEILTRYKSRLDEIHGDEHHNEIINACLYKPCIREDYNLDYPQTVSVKGLIEQGAFNFLNNQACGVYYLHTRKWIVIVWHQVKHTILDSFPYTGMGVAELKALASKNSHVIEDVTLKQHEEINSYLKLPDVTSPADYSAIALSYLFQNFEMPNMADCQSESSPILILDTSFTI